MSQVEPIKLTAFLDIMGFGEMIKTIDTEEKAQAFLSQFEILKVFEHVSTLMMAKDPQFESYKLSDIYNLKVLFVSDSIIISYMPQKDIVMSKIQDIESLNAEIFVLITTFIAQLQILTVKVFHRFLRGGICDEFSHINEMHAVGKGIIESYKLESKEAKYPRVIFKKDLLKKYKIEKYINGFDSASTHTSLQFFTVSNDEKFGYINYLKTFDFFRDDEQNDLLLPNVRVIKACADFIVLHLKIIEKELANAQEKKIFDMYIWLDNFQTENLSHLMINQFFRNHMQQTHPDEYNLITYKLSVQKHDKISLYKKIVFQFEKILNCLKQS